MILCSALIPSDAVALCFLACSSSDSLRGTISALVMDNSAQCYLGYISRGAFLALLSLRPVSRRSCELLHTNATVACVRSSRKDSLIEKCASKKPTLARFPCGPAWLRREAQFACR